MRPRIWRPLPSLLSVSRAHVQCIFGQSASCTVANEPGMMTKIAWLTLERSHSHMQALKYVHLASVPYSASNCAFGSHIDPMAHVTLSGGLWVRQT